MPSSAALASAPSFIFTKKGLVSVLVIRQAVIVSCAMVGTVRTAKHIAVLKRSFFIFSPSPCELGSSPACRRLLIRRPYRGQFNPVRQYINLIYLFIRQG